MQWNPNQDAKPTSYKLVTLRCKRRDGQILHREGFWTGYTWRIIGDKYKLHISIIEWSYNAELSNGVRA
jgi:hypothetical protein